MPSSWSSPERRKASPLPLYFAYGSNMDQAAMASRCPASKLLGQARLPRHRFVITSDGYASVARDPRLTVWGLVWDLALADVAALDRYEAIGSGLYAKATQAVLTDSGPRRALMYIAKAREFGVPRENYLEGVCAAARAAGLPADYVRQLEAWSPHFQPSAPASRPAVRPLFSSPLARTSR